MFDARTHTLIADGLDLVALTMDRKAEAARWRCGTEQEVAQRIAVVVEALTWLGTPYHDRGTLKGVGVDCAMLPALVYPAAGVIPPPTIPKYDRTWFLHRNEALYRDIVLQHAKPIDQDRAKPADLVLWPLGRQLAHVAIIVDPGWPEVVHALFEAGRVQRDRVDQLGDNRTGARFFSHWPPP